MAQKRYEKNILSLVPIKVGSSDPVDSRLVVENVSDLTNGNTWDGGTYKSIYQGMQVYVVATKETYMFIGSGATDGIPTTEVVKTTNWRKISSPESSVDKVEDNLNDIANGVGLSGTASGNSFAYSAHTTPSFISAQNPTTIQTEVIAIEKALTPTTATDANVSGTTAGDNIHKNIIKVESGGITAFADLHYDTSSNKLTFVNTNGKKDIELTGVNFISGADYDAQTEIIHIYYKKYGETSASTLNIPVGGLIEEYDFQYDAGTHCSPDSGFTESDHNVSLKTVRDVAGKTKVLGDINCFDCGTY